MAGVRAGLAALRTALAIGCSMTLAALCVGSGMAGESNEPPLSLGQEQAPEWIVACEAALTGLMLNGRYAVAAEEVWYAPSTEGRGRLQTLGELSQRSDLRSVEALQSFAVDAFFRAPGGRLVDHGRRAARIDRRGSVVLERHFYGGLPIDPRERRHEVAVLETSDLLVIHHPDEPSLFVRARDGSYSFLELSHILAPLSVPGESSANATTELRGGGWVALPFDPSASISPRSRMNRAFSRQSGERTQWIAFDADSGPYPVLFMTYDPRAETAVLVWLSFGTDSDGELRLRRVACDRIGREGSLRAAYQFSEWQAIERDPGPLLEVRADTLVRDERLEPPRVSPLGKHGILGLDGHLRVTGRHAAATGSGGGG